MKIMNKILWFILVTSLIFGSISSNGFCVETWSKQDPITEEWNVIDLFIARPLGIAAGILGTGLFILSLPFTIPTGGVDDAADMFIFKPFKFSFEREFPDEDKDI